MIFSLSSFIASALLVVNVSANILAGRQTSFTDQHCSTFMCVTATVNGSHVDYVLSSLGKRPLGWMAMGFGRQMANSPMVIMWAHEGKVVLSQRSASQHVMPTVDPSPPRIATAVDSLNSLTGDSSSFGYTIPSNGDKQQFIIFAYGTTNPGSSDVDADITQHLEYRTVYVDLTKNATPATTTTSDSAQPTKSHTAGSDDIPLLPYQRMIIAHAIFCAVGFLLFLPGGALLARYLRTYTPTWFTGHWVIQLIFSGPTIVTGIALGVASINKAGARHLDDSHKKLGVIIFALYGFQLALGAVIHFVKPRNSARRPIQNYIHVFLGLLIIVLAMAQVRSGFSVEWPKTTGREAFPNSVNILFYVWIVLITVLYLGGLALLPKQFKQENQPKRLPIRDEYKDYGQL